MWIVVWRFAPTERTSVSNLSFSFFSLPCCSLLHSSRRPHGRSKLRYKDQLKYSLKQAGIKPVLGTACQRQSSMEKKTQGRCRVIRDSQKTTGWRQTQTKIWKTESTTSPSLYLYHATTAHAYSITGWAFKVTFAIVINHRWQSPNSRRIPCSDTSGNRRLLHYWPWQYTSVEIIKWYLVGWSP